MSDILFGVPEKKLKTALAYFINILLNGELPLLVRETLFGDRLVALQKKDCGFRPIAVGYTLRRLIFKYGNSYVIKRRIAELQPVQVGVGVSGGYEAAVIAIRRLAEEIPDYHVLIELDFSNAFNTIRRDTILQHYRALSFCTPLLGMQSNTDLRHQIKGWITARRPIQQSRIL